MQVTRKELRAIINERVIDSHISNVADINYTESNTTFQTWQDFFNFLKSQNAPLPYLCYVYYLGGLSRGQDIDFFREFANHSDIQSYKEALIEVVSSAFTNPSTSFLSSDDRLYAIINNDTYGSAYSFKNVFFALIKNYFGISLTPEQQVMLTIGQAGAGGTQIETGSEYALIHPKHNNNNLVFKDAYDFTRFAFVEAYGKDFLTAPFKVKEDLNPIIFDAVYRIENVQIPEPSQPFIAQSVASRMEDELQAFPGGRIFNEEKLSRAELRKIITECLNEVI